MKLSNVRTGATSSHAGQPKSKIDAATFQKALTASTRQATGYNAQSEDGIRQAVLEYITENKADHQVVLMSGEAAIKPTIEINLYNHQAHRLSKSLLTITYIVGKKSFVATLILAGAGPNLSDYYITGDSHGRREQPVAATADMVFNGRAKSLVSRNGQATAFVESESVELSYYTYMVLPATVTFEDKQIIANMVDNMLDALDYQVREDLTTEDTIQLTLTDYLVHTTPRLSVDFTPDHNSLNAIGEPVRSDARAELKYEMKSNADDNGRNNRRNNKHTINNSAASAASISGYVNLNYFRDGIGEFNDKHFLPTLQLTSMDTGTRIPTIDDLMVSSYLSTTIVKDTNWVRLLEPSKLEQVNKDINSIISDLPPVYDDNGDVIENIDLNSQGEDFYNFMEAVCEDAPITLLVVPRGGATSWAYQPLMYSVYDEGVNTLLVDSLNRLTNDKFDKVIAEEGYDDIYIFEDHISVIHLGTYTDNNGNVHDLAEIDYLAVATYTEGSATCQATRERWDDTFLDEDEGGKDIGTRLNDRLDIMAQVVGGMSNINVTGYADVLMYNPQALVCIDRAFSNCGFRPKSEDQIRIRASQRGNRHLQATYENHGASYDTVRNSRNRNNRNGGRGQRNNGGRNRSRVSVVRN